MSSSSVWSSVVTVQMAEHAKVLALSILETWDSGHGSPPDLRPGPLKMKIWLAFQFIPKMGSNI